jgi:hypothetical protein
MEFFLILRTLHSFVRWVIVLVALVTAIKFAVGWLNKAKLAKNDRALMSAFTGLIDAQVLLGLILLVGQGLTTPIGFPMNRIEHMITMIVAAVIAHTPMAWKKDETATALRNNLFVTIVVVVLILFGVASLGGNRWL